MLNSDSPGSQARPTTLAPLSQEGAISSATGCGVDPGFEMTTSTLQGFSAALEPVLELTTWLQPVSHPCSVGLAHSDAVFHREAWFWPSQDGDLPEDFLHNWCPPHTPYGWIPYWSSIPCYDVDSLMDGHLPLEKWDLCYLFPGKNVLVTGGWVPFISRKL